MSFASAFSTLRPMQGASLKLLFRKQSCRSSTMWFNSLGSLARGPGTRFSPTLRINLAQATKFKLHNNVWKVAGVAGLGLGVSFVGIGGAGEEIHCDGEAPSFVHKRVALTRCKPPHLAQARNSLLHRRQSPSLLLHSPL